MSGDLFDNKARVVGTLEAVRFESQAGDFAIATVRSTRGRVTVIGNLLGAAPGEQVQLRGTWENNPKFGRQVRATDVLVLPPTTREGIIRYLSSGMISGFGAVLAERLVNAFGEKTLHVLEAERQRLLQVPGIGKVRQQRIIDAWDRQRAVRKVMLFLSTHGVSTTYAQRIYEKYGNDAVEIIKENPYRLARDIFGIAFRSADKVARSIGLELDSPERIIAGLVWTLDEGAGNGHVFLPREVLIEHAREILEVGIDAVETCLDRAILEGALVQDRLSSEYSEAIYSRASHTIERELAERVAKIARQRPRALTAAVLAKQIDAAERKMGISLEASQRKAVERLIGSGLAILTGGPGTGKTTILRVFTDAVSNEGGRVLLAAPTGRAARRLSEATNREAATIHRMLQFNFKEGGFLRDESNPLEADLIVVDEASMLDQRLIRGLIRAIPVGCGLLLVGDADQLPSVGPGNVLKDLLSVPDIPAARLTEVFRQAESSDIVKNAHRIRMGQLPESTTRKPMGRGEFFHIAVDDPELALKRVVEAVCERIPKAFGWDPIEQVQVLAPMHRGILGIRSINAELQARLNPKGKIIKHGDREFRVGDKVIQLRNNYTKEVFNGQIGRLESVDSESGDLIVRFEQQRIPYPKSELYELALAYCISIHKSQGSEYPVVVAPITTQHYVMLQRNLLYTAVTRAKELVCVIGQVQALRRAVRNADPMKRHTGLTDRIRTVLESVGRA